MFLFFFFFFQAEDGIRDLTVTGVQTCALPICLDAADARRHAAFRVQLEDADVAGAGDVRAAAELARAADVEHAHLVAVRSEERRVGKECRSRWWPYE